MDNDTNQNSRAAEADQQAADAAGDQGVAITKEDVDGSGLQDHAQIDSKKRACDGEDLDFQIEENSSDPKQRNHSSTAADNF